MVLTALALLLAGGCLPRAAPIQAPTPTPVIVAAVRDNLDSREVSAIPPELAARLTEQLSARQLQPELLSLSSVGEPFSRKRTSSGRLDLLDERGDLLLLVEAEAQFISQLGGRMRWRVDVRLSLDDDDMEPIVSEFSVPVFLLFLHQGPDDALLDAAPIIERNLSHLLDGYLAALQ